MVEPNPNDPPPAPPATPAQRAPRTQPTTPAGHKPAGGASDADRQDWYRLAGIGFEFIAAVLVVGGLGWWLDTRWDTSPWLLLSGVGLGFALGLYLLIREARRAFHD